MFKDIRWCLGINTEEEILLRVRWKIKNGEGCCLVEELDPEKNPEFNTYFNKRKALSLLKWVNFQLYPYKSLHQWILLGNHEMSDDLFSYLCMDRVNAEIQIGLKLRRATISWLNSLIKQVRKGK